MWPPGNWNVFVEQALNIECDAVNAKIECNDAFLLACNLNWEKAVPLNKLTQLANSTDIINIPNLSQRKRPSLGIDFLVVSIAM